MPIMPPSTKPPPTTQPQPRPTAPPALTAALGRGSQAPLGASVASVAHGLSALGVGAELVLLYSGFCSLF